jgi:hypothetical protein
MKRSAGNQIHDKSLNRIIDIGLPELRKGNTRMQSSPHVCDTNHEPAAITLEMEEIRFPKTLFTVHDENEQSHLLKSWVGTIRLRTKRKVRFSISFSWRWRMLWIVWD